MNKLLVSARIWLATRKSGKGQSLAEYGLILLLVVIFCVAACTALGGSISQMMIKACGDLSAAIGGG
jgi:Flp pilus assembly pilin Flp